MVIITYRCSVFIEHYRRFWALSSCPPALAALVSAASTVSVSLVNDSCNPLTYVRVALTSSSSSSRSSSCVFIVIIFFFLKGQVLDTVPEIHALHQFHTAAPFGSSDMLCPLWYSSSDATMFNATAAMIKHVTTSVGSLM